MNKVIKIIFIEMLTLEGRLEGDEEVHQMMSCGIIVQTKCTAKAKALD